MGQTLIEAVLAQEDLQFIAALEIPGSALLNHDAGERFGRTTGVRISSDVASALHEADVLIDFTRPEGTLAHAAACARAGVAAVIGTTGLSDADRTRLLEFARDIPMVFAPNMSVGVNVLLRLVELAAQRLGDEARARGRRRVCPRGRDR